MTQSRTPLRFALWVLFAVYLALLAWAILWKLQTPYVGAAAGVWRPIKLVPFIEFGEFGGSNPIEVLLNVALFVPFGVYFAALFPRRLWWVCLITCAASSLVLESLQHLLSVGSFDLTDVITNTVGGFIGWQSMYATRQLNHRPRTAFLLCLALTVLWVVAVVAFIVLVPHYGPQHDVIVR